MRRLALRIWVVGLLALPGLAAAVEARAQDAAATFVSELPESAGAMQAQPFGFASVSGVVVDVQGDPVPGAKVMLRERISLVELTMTTAVDGTYTCVDLQPGQYSVRVQAVGFEPVTLPEFAARAGERTQLARVALVVATASSSVNVVATRDQIATEQVREQEHQRVFGVIPNFYTSYIYDAAPMPTKVKYGLAFHALLDPVTLGINGVIAGIEQGRNTFPSWGGGAGAYGKRYAAQYGDLLFTRLFGSALLASAFHQDPRYFYQGSGGNKSRLVHALEGPLITRGDNGKRQVNYSRLLGSLMGAALSNAYKPAANRGIGLTFTTFGLSIGATAGDDILREFVLRRLEPTVPGFANGKKP